MFEEIQKTSATLQVVAVDVVSIKDSERAKRLGGEHSTKAWRGRTTNIGRGGHACRDEEKQRSVTREWKHCGHAWRTLKTEAGGIISGWWD